MALGDALPVDQMPDAQPPSMTAEQRRAVSRALAMKFEL